MRDAVEAATGARPAGPVRLLAGLRYFGHSFNPVTFYYCFDAAGARVEAVVADVENIPWGERHAYVLARGEREGTVIGDELEKSLHVSPLMGMDQTYAFRASRARRAPRGPHRVAPARRRGGQDLRRHPLPAPPRAAAAPLAGLLARYPAMSLQVVAKIYAQSLRLKLKGAQLPPPPGGEPPEGVRSP